MTLNEPRVAPTLILQCERTNKFKLQQFNHNETNKMRKTQNLINITNKQVSKVNKLLSLKSGSHHTKNIYPQISNLRVFKKLK